MESTGTLDGIVDRPNHTNHGEVILAVNDAAKRLCDHVLVLDDQDGDGHVYLICAVGQLSHQAHPLPCANGRDPMMILMGRLEGCNGGGSRFLDSRNAGASASVSGMALGSAQVQQRFENPREILGDRLKEGSIYRLLADHGHQMFDDEYFSDLYTESPKGRPTIPARVMATVMVLQAFEGLSARAARRE